MSEGQLSILARTARGAGWMVAWRLATRVLGLGSTLILVRLMEPSEFGLIALAWAFIATLDICLSMGVEDQIVRMEAPSREIRDTAFTINFMRSLLITGVVIAAAGPVARFFDAPQMQPVLIVLAIAAGLGELTNIGVVDFRRDLQFDREFLLNLVPRLAGIVVTVGAAFVLQSHWALVLGIVVGRIGVLLLSYIMHPFRPRLALSAWRDLVGVSAWTWLLSVVYAVRDRADSFFIGRQLGAAQVGFFGAGVEIATLPSSELVEPICRACMSGFAAGKREGSGGGTDYERIIGVLALATLPAGLGISLIAAPLVALAYGPRWLEMVPVVEIVGVGATLAVFGSVSTTMLNAHTRLAQLAYFAMATCGLRLVLLMALIPSFGLAGAAFAGCLTMLADAILASLAAMRMLQMRKRRVLDVLWRPAVAAAVMAATLWGGGLGWAEPPAEAADAVRVLVVGILAGACTYVASVVLLWLAAGRPVGGETDLFNLLRRTLPFGLGRRSNATQTAD